MKKTILNLALFSTLVTAGIAVYHHMIKPKTAYIDIKKVFNGFDMKKELESQFKITAQKREKILDSVAVNLRVLSKHLAEQASKADPAEVSRFELKREEYFRMKQKFEEDNAALSRKYDGQILERLTGYVNEYGKEKQYDFIYGADGNGNLMFARDSYDLSNEIIQYINTKYKGS